MRSPSLPGLALILSAALGGWPAANAETTQQPSTALAPVIEAGAISWSIDNKPLREVLEQLSLHFGFELTVSPKLPAQTVTGDYTSVPIDKALSRILGAQNYIIGRSPTDEISHIYLFAEGETPTVNPRATTPIKSTAKNEKQKLIDDLEALLPPGTLTQTMKDALLAGTNPPSAAEIAEIRSRQSAIFEEFKARFDPMNQTQSDSGKN